MNRKQRRAAKTLAKKANGNGNGKGNGSSSYRRIEAGASQSLLKVLAENRGGAPALFVLDVFSAPPSKLRLGPDDPAFLFRVNAADFGEGQTDPGKAIALEVQVSYEAEHNERGPKLWFQMPGIELTQKFFLHHCSWNGANMLAQEGVV